MSQRPSVAAVTVVKDESVMLPLWLHHYGERLGLDHLVVLDDQSTDGSTEGIAAEVQQLGGLPGGTDFERGRLKAANQTARRLLDTFDWVVFTDADEFLVHDPARHDSLRDLLPSVTTPAIGPLALNVVQDLEAEQPLDTTRPILDQRSYGYFAPNMCKPSTKRRRVSWVVASHGIRSRFEVRDDLFMLHLKFADLERLKVTAAHRRGLNAQDGRGGGSWNRDDVVQVFERRMRATDFGAAAEFDPGQVDRGSLNVQTPSGNAWRTTKMSQLSSMRDNPVVRIPARLRGLL